MEMNIGKMLLEVTNEVFAHKNFEKNILEHPGFLRNVKRINGVHKFYCPDIESCIVLETKFTEYSETVSIGETHFITIIKEANLNKVYNAKSKYNIDKYLHIVDINTYEEICNKWVNGSFDLTNFTEILKKEVKNERLF